MRVGIAHDTSYDVTSVALDDYVAGVVDAEAPPEAPPAFRRVLAIVARTWVARNRDRHAADGFSVCDLTHCQVFRPALASGREAATQTRGIVLRGRDGALADAAYSASCGGTLETGPDPAAIAHDDAWRAELEHQALLAALRPLGVGGTQIDRIAVVSRTASGRARVVAVRTDRDYPLDAERFRLAVGRSMGWQHLKSTWFDVAPFSRGFVFTGRGFGHGLGLCVRGAGAMIARGEPVERVLAAYFPATAPATGPDSVDLRVHVPKAASDQRGPLERRVRSDVAVLAVRLGMGVPRQIDIVAHPTIESFQRATGLGWWASARSRGHQIDLAPIDMLTRRGRLEVVVAHELVHLLTATRLDGRPRWVHEGIAVVFARERVAGGQTAPGPCPSDEEFARATPETLPLLYARAAVCVTRELATRSWDAIGGVDTRLSR